MAIPSCPIRGSTSAPSCCFRSRKSRRIGAIRASAAPRASSSPRCLRARTRRRSELFPRRAAAIDFDARRMGKRMDRSILDRIDQRVIALYDDFTHRHLDRRLFMERLTALVGATAAAAMLPLLRSNYALAQQVRADDARLAASMV